MNTSLNWIKAMVPGLEVTDQEFRDAMTLSGTKVENFTAFDKNLDKIVVGQIESVEKHPDADKLVICQVNVGSETVQIVTGAPNIPVGSSGQKVPVVLDGGRVAGGHDGGALPEDGIKIKKGKLRGVESFGMMCAIEGLGSSREFYPDAPENGIYILGDDAQVGEDAVHYLGLDDTVFEYEITNNRVDCHRRINALCAKHHKSCRDCTACTAAFHAATEITANRRTEIFVNPQFIGINPHNRLRTVINHRCFISKFHCFFNMFIHQISSCEQISAACSIHYF